MLYLPRFGVNVGKYTSPNRSYGILGQSSWLLASGLSLCHQISTSSTNNDHLHFGVLVSCRFVDPGAPFVKKWGHSRFTSWFLLGWRFSIVKLKMSVYILQKILNLSNPWIFLGNVEFPAMQRLNLFEETRHARKKTSSTTWDYLGATLHSGCNMTSRPMFIKLTRI